MTRNDYLALSEGKKTRRKTRLKDLVKQDFQCSICRCPITGKEAHWDHCHTSGKFRAFLCRTCNVGLGMFKDNPDLLRKAALYLDLHS